MLASNHVISVLMYRTAVTIEKKSPFRTNQTNLVRPVGTHFPDSDRRSIHCPLHIDLGNTHFISAQLEKVSTSVNYNDSPHSTYKHSCLCFWECVCGFGEMLHNTMPSHFLVAQHSERERERERKRERERERERETLGKKSESVGSAAVVFYCFTHDRKLA